MKKGGTFMNYGWITEEQKTKFEEEGYLVIKGVYSIEAINIIIQTFEKEWLKLAADGKIIQAPNRPLNSLYPRLRDYHRDNKVITDFILNKKAVEILEELIEEEPLVVQTSYYFKAPGSSGLPMHQDNYSIGAIPDTTYAMWVSLDPSDQENGGLKLVPKTHISSISSPEEVHEKESVYRKKISVPAGYKEVEINTEPGDVVIFNGNVLHGSSDNISKDRFRRALVTHYVKSNVEKITLNYNFLIDKNGRRIRRKFNSKPQVVETKDNFFEFTSAKYYDQIIKRD